MKQIYLILCILFLSFGLGFAFTEAAQKGLKTEGISEKKSKLDEGSFWEDTDKVPTEKQGFNDLISSDDTPMLNAPPPGEDGNPQKIVTPLGDSDWLVMILLSVFSMGIYFVKKRNRCES